jgi:hypothetical protein
MKKLVSAITLALMVSAFVSATAFAMGGPETVLDRTCTTGGKQAMATHATGDKAVMMGRSANHHQG